jgi:hypothetical protein
MFGDRMHSPASKTGRKRAPSLKGLLAMMAGFFIVFIILAELANATTSSQPSNSPPTESTPVVASPVQTSTETTDVVAETPTATRPRSLSYGVNEVIKMYEGGVAAEILLTYIDTANLSYQLSSKEILYLNQIGVPSEIVNAMIRRDHQTELAQANNQQQQADTMPPLPEPATLSGAYLQSPGIVFPRPGLQYASVPVCSTRVNSSATCSTICQAGPNVTIIGSRSGSALFNGYYGHYSPARAYFNAEFGYNCEPSYYDFGWQPHYGGRGFGHGGHRWGRF